MEPFISCVTGAVLGLVVAYFNALFFMVIVLCICVENIFSVQPLSQDGRPLLCLSGLVKIYLWRGRRLFLRSLDSSSLRCFTPFDCISHTRKHTEMYMCSLSLSPSQAACRRQGKGCMCCVVYSWKIKMLFCCSCVLQEDFMLKIACLFGSVC